MAENSIKALNNRFVLIYQTIRLRKLSPNLFVFAFTKRDCLTLFKIFKIHYLGNRHFKRISETFVVWIRTVTLDVPLISSDETSSPGHFHQFVGYFLFRFQQYINQISRLSGILFGKKCVRRSSFTTSSRSTYSMDVIRGCVWIIVIYHPSDSINV